MNRTKVKTLEGPDTIIKAIQIENTGKKKRKEKRKDVVWRHLRKSGEEWRRGTRETWRVRRNAGKFCLLSFLMGSMSQRVEK